MRRARRYSACVITSYSIHYTKLYEFQGIEWNMPNLLMAGVPGFEGLATTLMKQTVKNHGVATVNELRDLCIEAEVKLVACQMTVDLFRNNFV